MGMLGGFFACLMSKLPVKTKSAKTKDIVTVDLEPTLIEKHDDIYVKEDLSHCLYIMNPNKKTDMNGCTFMAKDNEQLRPKTINGDEYIKYMDGKYLIMKDSRRRLKG